MALLVLAAVAVAAAVILFLARVVAARLAPTTPLIGLSLAALLGVVGALAISIVVASGSELMIVAMPLGGLLGMLVAYQRQFQPYFVFLCLFLSALLCVGAAWVAGELLASAVSVAVAAYCYRLLSSAQIGD